MESSGAGRAQRPPDPPPPPELVARVRERDPEALDTFFALYFDRAFGYVRRLVRDVTEAEDITQTAFLKIHRAIHTLDVDRDPTSWVFAVVSNTVRDFWRSRRHRQSKLQVSIENHPVASDHTVHEEQEARDAMRVVEEAMAGLSGNLRAVVLLRDYEDLSYAEVAEALGIAETAARKRHSRALTELRRALAEAGGEPPPHE